MAELFSCVALHQCTST